MKFVHKSLAGAALAGLVLTQPLAAEAATPQAVRAPAPTQQADQLHGHVGAAVVVIGVAALLGLIFWAAGLFDSSDKPHSP